MQTMRLKLYDPLSSEEVLRNLAALMAAHIDFNATPKEVLILQKDIHQFTHGAYPDAKWTDNSNQLKDALEDVIFRIYRQQEWDLANETDEHRQRHHVFHKIRFIKETLFPNMRLQPPTQAAELLAKALKLTHEKDIF